MTPMLGRLAGVAPEFIGELDPDEEVVMGNWEDDAGSACSGATDCAVPVADDSDTTFVQTELINTMGGCASPEVRNIRFGFDDPAVPPTGAETVNVRVTARYTTAGMNGDTGSMVVKIYELTTLRHTFGSVSLTTSFVTHVEGVPQSVKDAIGDWDDIRVDVEHTLCEEDGADMRGQVSKIDIQFI